MIHMTKCDDWITHGCVVLGCELLSEFRNNGSANSIQQKIVNPSNGFVWLSQWDYRGLIKPDDVYYVYFGADGLEGTWDPTAPEFSIEHSDKYVLTSVYDTIMVDTVYVPIGVDVYSPTYCHYDGIKK